SLNDEIARASSRRTELRPDAGVARLESSVGECGKIGANRRIKRSYATLVERVVDAIDEGDVGPEASLATEIERDVNSEASRFGNRIYEPPERGTTAEHEVMSFVVVKAGN